MDTRSLIVNKLFTKHKENVQRNWIPLPKSSHQRIMGGSGIPIYTIPPTVCPFSFPTLNLGLRVTTDSEFGVKLVGCAEPSCDTMRDLLRKRRFTWKERVPLADIRLSSVM
jgi:hypothetical protein